MYGVSKMKRKNITIEEEQDEYIEKNAINLSKLVRHCIDDKRNGDSQ